MDVSSAAPDDAAAANTNPNKATMRVMCFSFVGWAEFYESHQC